MNIKDKISDIYRRKVENLPDDPTDHGTTGSLDEEEIDDIWEEISIELDIDETWTDISSDLNILMPSGSNSGTFLRIIAAIIIISMGLIPVKNTLLKSPGSISKELHGTIILSGIENNHENLINGDLSGKDIQPDNEEYHKRNKSEVYEESIEKHVRKEAHKVSPVAVDCLTPDIIAASENNESKPFHPLNFIQAGDYNLPSPFVKNSGERIKLYSGPDVNNLIKTSNILKDGRYMQTERGRGSIGIITSFRNTWLINNETFNGFKSESLNTTEFVFYPDLGLCLSYPLSNKWGVQLNGFFSSNTGQEYLDYIYGQYSRKKIILNYSTIDISIKYKINTERFLGNSSSINLLTGGYMSFLHYAYQKINSSREDIGSQYNKVDLGLRLGGELEIPLFMNLSLAPGIFISYGIPNIYKGDDFVPGYFRKTHNASAEFHLTFYYHYD